MNPLDTLDIFSGVFGGVTAAFGGIVLLVPRVSATKWTPPVLGAATLITIGLLIYQIISLIIASRTPRPPVTWTPEQYQAPAPAPAPAQLPPLQPPTAVPLPQPQPQPPASAPLPAAQQPTTVVPPHALPIPAPQPQPTNVTGPDHPDKPSETMTFNSMEEFQQWIAQQQPPKEQSLPVPSMIKKPEPLPPVARQPIFQPQPAPAKKPEPLPQKVPSKGRDRVPSSSKPQVTPPPPAPVVVAPSAPPSSSKPALPQGSIDVTGSSLTSNEAMQMLESHNQRRAKYGTPPLTWDPEIARSAQAWSDRQASMGRMQHEDQDKYGENLSYARGRPQSPEDVLVGWVDEEARNYNRQNHWCEAGTVCGHFTAAISRISNKVGCGRAKSGNAEYWTCRYRDYANMNMGDASRGSPGDAAYRAY